MTTRIDRRFAALKEQGRKGLVTFVTAGDPDYDTRVDDMLFGLLDLSMVTDDGVRETMVGGAGADWFLHYSDYVSDLGKSGNPEEREN